MLKSTGSIFFDTNSGSRGGNYAKTARQFAKRGLDMSFHSIFFIIACSYIMVNIYLIVRVNRTLAGTGPLRALGTLLTILGAISLPLAIILHRSPPSKLFDLLFAAGSLYMPILIYAFMLTIAADTLLVVNRFVRLTPHRPPYSMRVRFRAVAAIAAASLLVTAAGAINALFPTVKYISVDVEQHDAEMEGAILRIAALSDIHLGQFVSENRIRRLTELVRAQRPDIIFLAGDTIDSESWLRKPNARVMELIGSLDAPLGVFAVFGNHEYYAGADAAGKALEDAGIRVLRDEAAAPGGQLLVIGREDRSMELRAGGARKTLAALRDEAYPKFGESARNLPLIVLDHQPIGLEEAEQTGAALQISGHTHRGQLFPVNFLVAMLYEKHYGEYARGNTRYYISSGAGTWGPPVRTSGRPEVAVIDLVCHVSARNAEM